MHDRDVRMRLPTSAALALAIGGAFVWNCCNARSVFAATSGAPFAALAEAGHDADSAHSQAEHIGHAGGGAIMQHPLEPRVDIAIATAAVFLGLLWILKRYAWGPISAGLEKREAGIAASIRGAEDANRAAQAVLKEHEKRLADTATQVRAMLDEARRDAEQTKREIEAEAKMSAEAERARSLREIDTATSQALKSLAEKSANLAVELAGKIVQVKLSPAEHTRLIEEAMSRFPNAPSSPTNRN